jgi:hypothetical protein
MKEIWEIPKCSATDRRNPNALQTSPLYSRNFQIEKNRSAEVYIYTDAIVHFYFVPI